MDVEIGLSPEERLRMFGNKCQGEYLDQVRRSSGGWRKSNNERFAICGPTLPRWCDEIEEGEIGRACTALADMILLVQSLIGKPEGKTSTTSET
jgi:hypothetical protein